LDCRLLPTSHSKNKKIKTITKETNSRKVTKARKDLEEKKEKESEKDWMLEKNKNADQENVDHEVIGILGHIEKLSATSSDSRKEYFI
jgi:hypothetical protein